MGEFSTVANQLLGTLRQEEHVGPEGHPGDSTAKMLSTGPRPQGPDGADSMLTVRTVMPDN